MEYTVFHLKIDYEIRAHGISQGSVSPYHQQFPLPNSKLGGQNIGHNTKPKSQYTWCKDQTKACKDQKIATQIKSNKQGVPTIKINPKSDTSSPPSSLKSPGASSSDHYEEIPGVLSQMRPTSAAALIQANDGHNSYKSKMASDFERMLLGDKRKDVNLNKGGDNAKVE